MPDKFPITTESEIEEFSDAEKFPHTYTEDGEDLSPQEFCRNILSSEQFRAYLLDGITNGNLPSAVVVRIMDIAWGKPKEMIEHTGPDGQPVVVKIVRLLVDARHSAEQVDQQGAESERVH